MSSSPTRNLWRLSLGVIVGGLLLLPAPAPAQMAGADLIVDTADLPDPAAVGAPLTYTVTVTNNGPEPADSVELEDVLPWSSTFESATPSQGTCSQVLPVVTCALGSLADQAAATVTIVVTPTGSGTLNNLAAAESTAVDPNPANNLDTETTTVAGGAGPGTDLAIQKSDAPDPIPMGEDLTYVLTVANVGREAADGVALVDVLPIGTAVDSINPSTGTCTGPLVVVVICDLGALPEDASETVQIVTESSREGPVANLATVASETADANAANNVSVANTTIDDSAGGAAGGKGSGACTIRGTALDDVLKGTQGKDVICGMDGDDRLKGLGGKDTLIAGKGNDRLNGGKGSDILRGQPGKDRLRGAQKRDRLMGGPSKDRLNGGPGRDRCSGGNGDVRRSCG